ncbi:MULTISPECIES: hypothetical protein [unclassified Niallia]|uniref:hypothetical protein n=1 Tax=unclassified Niallia TaxID=2837522 RepID=UPI00203F2207|nr:hypothetical protein [Niallia sp. MER 6]MCM3030365.1 hypothetical protein [Niallia sp. MER 6]
MKIQTLMKKHKKEELASMLLAAQSKLDKLNQGVLFHTDSDINHTSLIVDGEPVQDMTAIRIFAHRSSGVEVSYESLNSNNEYNRNWVYGEDANLTRVYKEYRRLKNAEDTNLQKV